MVRSKWKGLLFIFLVMLISHSNIFVNEFSMADYSFIVNWPFMQDLGNFVDFFLVNSPPVGVEGVYSPIKTLFLSINYNFFGLKPVGYHIVSLLIHCLGIWLVYEVCFFLSQKNLIAFISSLLFALHPVRVESTTSMTASVDMIGIVLLLAAFLLFCKSDCCNKGGMFLYILSVIVSFLSVFAHELAISLPILFLFYSLFFSRKQQSIIRKIAVVLPFFLIVLFYLFAKHQVLSDIAMGEYVYDSFYLTMLISVKAVFKYVLICFFPFVLTFNHVISPGIYSFAFQDFDKYAVLSQSIFDARTLLALCSIVAIIAFAVKQFKKEPLVSFCIGWFFLCLLPVSNLVPTEVLFGERYLYPGLLGFCLLIGIYSEKLLCSQKRFIGKTVPALTVILLFVVTIFYGVRTFARNSDWRNDIFLRESAIRANPYSSMMKHELGIVYSRHGEYEKAIAIIDQALSIKKDPVFYFTQANVYMNLNKYTKAIETLKKVIALEKNYADAYYNLASVYAYLGADSEAAENISKAIYYYQQQDRYDDSKDKIKAFEDYFGIDVAVREVMK